MASATLERTGTSAPTHVRYGVLAFACTLSMITYLDRVCMASAAKQFVNDLGLSTVGDLKVALSAFALAYALFEIPSGWLGDVFGPRKVLIRIVLWWSAFTAITGLIGMRMGGYVLGSMTILVVVRFLFGAGEAGSFPNITRALHNWFPFQQRGFAQGAVWMCGRLMGGLTPLVWMVLVEGTALPGWLTGGSPRTLAPLMHWRATFWAFAAVGVGWCVLFFYWFRDRPEQKNSVNEAELALIRQSATETQAAHANVPWLRILKSGNLWFLGTMYACQTYGWYFFITYLPQCLETQYGVLPTSVLGSIYKGGPLWLGAAGCLLGGFLTDWFIRRTGNRRLGRKIFGVIGHAMCVVCFLLCPYAPSAFWFFLTISLAGFFCDLTMGSSWALCQDVGRRHAAIVAGFMNMIGNLGGAVATWISGWVLSRGVAAYAASHGKLVTHLTDAEKTAGLLTGYHLNFYVFAAVYVVGVFCWLMVDSTKPVAPEEGH